MTGLAFSPLRLCLASAAILAACRSGRVPLGQALAQSPIESVALRVPLAESGCRQLLRTILFQNGYQVHAENSKAGWMRTNVGGVWDDRYRQRQWHLVLSLAYDVASAETTVTLRALQVSTSYIAGVRRSNGALESTNGFTSVSIISDATRGEAQFAWGQLERVAVALGDVGAVRILEPARR